MNASILTMLAAPYLLFAGICGLMVRAVKRAKRQRDAARAAADAHGTATATNLPPQTPVTPSSEAAP